MTPYKTLMTVAAAAAALSAFPSEKAYDLVAYGSSPAALTAAIEAQRHGKTAVVVHYFQPGLCDIATIKARYG